MIGTLISIIIVLIITGVLFWAVQTILAKIPLAEPFATLIHVLMVLVAVLVALWVIVLLLENIGVNVPFVRLKS